MKFNIIANESLKANAYALFFVKKSVQFSSILSENGEKQVESVLNGMKDGPFEDLEFLEIDGKPTFFVDAAKERGISALDHLRMAAYRLAERAQKKQVPTVSIFLADAADEQFKAILHGLFYADYRFDAYKSKQEPKFQVTFEIVAGEHVKDFKKIAEDVAIEQKAVTLARNLINTCASDLYPAEFVENAKTIAKYTPGLSIKVRDMKQLQKEGFMGHVTVGKGSSHEPYMITLSYDGTKGAKRTSKDHLVIVGKGLTFDTGGLCLKPPKSMPEMISDMSGAATALAAIQAVATLKLPIRVSAVCCLAENAIGNKSVLPGDIFKAKNGKTVMVDNTDAEGRLVLSDGLAEAGEIGATHIVVCRRGVLQQRRRSRPEGYQLRRSVLRKVLEHAAGRRIRRRAQGQVCRPEEYGYRCGRNFCRTIPAGICSGEYRVGSPRYRRHGIHEQEVEVHRIRRHRFRRADAYRTGPRDSSPNRGGIKWPAQTAKSAPSTTRTLSRSSGDSGDSTSTSAPDGRLT